MSRPKLKWTITLRMTYDSELGTRYRVEQLRNRLDPVAGSHLTPAGVAELIDEAVRGGEVIVKAQS